MDFTALNKLFKDLQEGSRTLNDDEARFLVDTYYIMQDQRIRNRNQTRALAQTGEPNEVLLYFGNVFEELEGDARKALQAYVKTHLIGDWVLGVKGIGPVIAAGIISAIDIERAPTAGHIWSYAGLNPNQEWGKGQKRPWNAQLKRICWLAGESFVKVHSRKGAVYGQMYSHRKELEIAQNEAGKFSDQAASILEKKNIGKTTDAYKAYSKGKLPPAHIHARAKRFAVKMFLSHLHQVWYETHFKKPIPAPYVIAHQGHVHYIPPPNYTSPFETPTNTRD